MGKEYTAIYCTGPPDILIVDGRRERVERKSFGVCIAIAKEQEPVAGFAEHFGMSGDVIAKLLD